MRDQIEHELNRHTAALRRLACALVGEPWADDLVQDTMVQALASPAPPPRSWAAWLGTVLRFLAHKHRRSEVRRRKREASLAADDSAPAADHAAEHAETLRHLTDAVLALPQPYRDVVLLRFLRGAPPAAIAAETGVPVATVKSRLQRGLALLRTGMVTRHPRHDWRAALAGAFALRPAATTSAAAGGMYMAIGTKWALGLGALLLAAATLEWYRWQTAPVPPAPSPVLVAGTAAHAKAAPEDAAAARQQLPAVVAGGSWAEVRGRCVDPGGEPLPGITASLHWSDVRPDPAVFLVTAADGRFTLRNRAPEPGPRWTSTLALQGEGRCALRFGELRSTVGDVKDLGDVTMLPAISVQGRLVDRRQQPIAGATLQLWHATMSPSEQLGTAQELHTGPDGTFGPSIGLPPGRGFVQGEDRHLVGEVVAFALDPLRPTVELELVAIDRSELPGIGGSVVDEAGAAIPGASVHLLTDTVTTGADGAFRVVCSERQFGPGPFHLQVWADDCEEGRPGPFALGETDARIVLHRSPTLTVRVRRAEDRQPVEQFGLVVWRQQARARPHQLDTEARAMGLATVPGLCRGEYVVTIVPAGEEFPPFTSEPFLLDRDATIDVEVTRGQSRWFALADVEGRPLAGVLVELLQPNGAEITVDANAADFGDMTYVEPTSPLRLLRGRTGANGELLLRGPAGRPLALRLGGPGPVQSLVQPIWLDPPTRLEHRMPVPCECRGRLVPADVVQDLLRGDGRSPQRLSLAVHRGPVPRYALTGPRVEVAADGSFATTLPEGRWQLTMLYGAATLPLGTIDVRPGPASDVDVSAFRRSDVELRLLVDGEPLAYGSVDCVVGQGPFGAGSKHWMDTHQADQQGHVRLRTFPGVLTAAVRMPPAGGLAQLVVFPAQGITVPGGTTLRHTIDVHPVPIEIHVRTPSGRPAAGVLLRLAGTGVQGPTLLPADGAGVARAQRVDAGRYTVLTAPRSHGDDITAIAPDAWFAAGAIEVRRGTAGNQHELTLPPEWDR